jgi:hypothetical protein
MRCNPTVGRWIDTDVVEIGKKMVREWLMMALV